jgi:hypothetical protein
LIEFIAQIIVFGDIPTGGAPAVGPQQMLDAVGDLEEVESELFGAGTGKGRGLIQVQDGPGDQFFDVIGIAIPLHVGFAETDIAMEQHPRKKSRTQNSQGGGVGMPLGAEMADGPIRKLQPQMSGVHLLQRRHYQPLVQA